MKTHHILSLTGVLMLALGHIGYVVGNDALTIFSITAALPLFLPTLTAQMRGRRRGERLRPSEKSPQHAY